MVATLLALAAAGALLLVPAGHTTTSGGAGHAAPAPRESGPPELALIGGVPLQQARCVQWQQGTPAERTRVVDALAKVVGGPTPYGPGSTLPAAEASALFDRACSGHVATHWLLYEMYIRAAGLRSYSGR